MTYYSEIAAAAGLKLEPDVAPYTGTTLGAAASVIDGEWNNTANVADWQPAFSYGVDLGSSTAVDRLFLFVDQKGSWRGSSYSTFGVYKSDDNATWIFVQTFISPSWDFQCGSGSGFNLGFTATQTARYFKVVNTGSGGINTSDGGYYYCEAGQIIAYLENAGADPSIRLGVETSVSFDEDNAGPNIVLSNSDLTAKSPTDANETVLGPKLPSAGKWYWEVTCNTAKRFGTESYRYSIGVCTDAATNLNHTPGCDNSTGWGVGSGGYLWYNAANHETVLFNFLYYISTYQNVLAVAFDADTGKMWFKFHTWGASGYLGDPAAGTGAHLSGLSGDLYPYASFPWANDQMTINFGASDFTYPVPSGFSVLQSPIIESVVIDSPPNVRELINRIAYEASSIEYWDAGQHNLVYLPTHTTVSKTIDANRIDSESVNVRYTDRVDLLNALTLWYNYYWAGYSGDDAFRETVTDSDSTSIADYGTLEKDPFQFKYLEGTQNAERALRWILTQSKNPRVIVSFTGGYYLTDIRRGNLINFDFEDDDDLDVAFSRLVSTSDKFMVTNIVRGHGHINIEAVQMIAV